MIAKPSELTGGRRPTLRVIDGDGGRPSELPEVVAEVLSDGTIRLRSQTVAEGAGHGFATGHVTGDGWTIWWDRRYWS
jgi:hypothetical protein